MTRKSLLDELAKLSAAERLLLAQDLCDSVADEPEALELSPEHLRELKRRLAAYRERKKKGAPSGSAWDEVKARIRNTA